jgi:hypothetical protein
MHRRHTGGRIGSIPPPTHKKLRNCLNGTNCRGVSTVTLANRDRSEI